MKTFYSKITNKTILIPKKETNKQQVNDINTVNYFRDLRKTSIRRLSKMFSSGSQVDSLIGKSNHFTRYCIFPFFLRDFRIFSTRNTVSSSITMSSGCDCDCCNLFSCSDNKEFSLELETRKCSLALAFSTTGTSGSKQSFGKSDSQDQVR